MNNCVDCKKDKPIKEFYTRPDSKDGGVQSYCKVCCRARKHAWYELTKNDPKVRFKNLKSSSKQRKLEVTITLAEYTELCKQVCHYCSASLEKHTGSGLDRKDNAIGYTLENTVTCCSACNAGKGEFYSYEEWQVMIKACIRYRKKNGRRQQTRTAGPSKARTL